VEMSRYVPGSDASGSFGIDVTNVKLAFDSCMDYKEAHGECLEVFGKKGGSSDLRNSHQEQARCICSTVPGDPSGDLPADIRHYCNTIAFSSDGDVAPGCPEWRKCLGADAKAVLLKTIHVVNALKTLAVAEPPPQLLLAQDLTQKATCTSVAHGLCVDPSSFDIEAFDCNCFDWMKTSSKAQINKAFCDNENVCCDWKKSGQCAGYSFLEVEGNMSKHANSKKGNMLERQTKDSQHVTSLDDSVSGKRSCSER